MPDFCLVNIFKYLSIDDLLNLADTTKSFKNATELAFSGILGRRLVCLELRRTNFPHNNDRRMVITEENFIIYHFPHALKVLRCFRSTITRLHIYTSRMADHRCIALISYLCDYCFHIWTENPFVQNLSILI